MKSYTGKDGTQVATIDADGHVAIIDHFGMDYVLELEDDVVDWIAEQVIERQLLADAEVWPADTPVYHRIAPPPGFLRNIVTKADGGAEE